MSTRHGPPARPATKRQTSTPPKAGLKPAPSTKSAQIGRAVRYVIERPGPSATCDAQIGDDAMPQRDQLIPKLKRIDTP